MTFFNRRCLSYLSVLALLTVASSTSALALDPVDGPNADEPDHHTLAITISPIHLAGPIVELTAEVAAHEKIGVSGIVGVGKLLGLDVLEFGAAVRGYVIGDFDHGMQIGLELLYVDVAIENGETAGNGSGFGVGPFVGYKITIDAGFTFEAQLGAQYFSVSAEAEGETASESGFIPLLNLNVGWAF